MPIKKYTLSLALMSLCLIVASAQPRFPEHAELQEGRNKGSAILVHLVGIGFHLPGGDLADRFGNSGSVGFAVDFLTKNNFFVGAEGYYFFGQQVLEDPLTPIRNPDGTIIGNDRLFASIALRERGWYYGVRVGKLFPLTASRTGIRVSVGAGWTQHKIRVQDDTETVTQLTGDYLKGYDRLTGGLALNEFLGWQILSENRRSNFILGLEFQQGFTNTLRDWDFAERRKLEGARLDLRFGIRAVWTLPLYIGGSEDIYY